MKAFRVLVAEDHPEVHELLVKLISNYYQVIEVVCRGDEVLKRVSARSPDAVVLDVCLPGRSGLQVLPELRQGFPQLAVIVLTIHTYEVYRREAMKCGADCFIDKVKAWRELNPAIGAAVSSRRQMSALLSDPVLNCITG